MKRHLERITDDHLQEPLPNTKLFSSSGRKEKIQAVNTFSDDTVM